MSGRMALAGGPANWVYSGRFVGFVYLRGKRKRLVDWWAMFPNNEHHYAAQQSKPEARDAIKALIEIRKGLPVVKVKGGYPFDPEAHEHRQKSKQGQTPPRNPIAATPD